MKHVYNCLYGVFDVKFPLRMIVWSKRSVPSIHFVIMWLQIDCIITRRCHPFQNRHNRIYIFLNLKFHKILNENKLRSHNINNLKNVKWDNIVKKILLNDVNSLNIYSKHSTSLYLWIFDKIMTPFSSYVLRL